MSRDPLEFIKRLHYSRVGDEESKEKNGWRWKHNVNLYRNPEFFCPHCKTWDETGLIWLVDERRYRLLGVWHMDGRAAYGSFSYIHPHVSGSSICRGNATSAAAALFASIHPDNPYHDIKTWLKELGHAENCSYFAKIICNLCEKKRSSCYMTSFGSSSFRVCEEECYLKAATTRCYKCFENRDTSMDGKRGSLCEKCFDKTAAPCGICSEKWSIDRMRRFRTDRICPTCCETKKRKCGGCAKFFLIKDLDLEQKCIRSCTQVYCNYCSGITTSGERDNRGYCGKCQERGSKPCSRCEEPCNEARGYCDNCIYLCNCDCNCEEEVSDEGYRCSACQEGDHDY